MAHGSRRRTSHPTVAAADPKSLIRDRALALGFQAIGFCRAELGPEARERLAAFLAAGQHGEMGWLARRSEQRSHPQALWPQACSVIALGLSYAPDGDPLATLTRPDRGNISVYARNRDYHDLLKGRLKHLAQFVASRFGAAVKVFVDTAPVMEKPLAERGGIGWQGKHTNLVSRAHGSWLFLGEIYTTLPLDPDEPHRDRCGTCTRCMAACPAWSSAGDTAKMSTVMKPDFKNCSVALNCAASWLAVATAVFAAGKRCECTLPSRFPGSFDATSGM